VMIHFRFYVSIYFFAHRYDITSDYFRKYPCPPLLGKFKLKRDTWFGGNVPQYRWK
jgi:hypothetical protein